MVELDGLPFGDIRGECPADFDLGAGGRKEEDPAVVGTGPRNRSGGAKGGAGVAVDGPVAHLALPAAIASHAADVADVPGPLLARRAEVVGVALAPGPADVPLHFDHGLRLVGGEVSGHGREVGVVDSALGGLCSGLFGRGAVGWDGRLRRRGDCPMLGEVPRLALDAALGGHGQDENLRVSVSEPA